MNCLIAMCYHFSVYLRTVRNCYSAFGVNATEPITDLRFCLSVSITITRQNDFW